MDAEFHIAVCDDIQTDREQIAGMTEEILSGEQIPHSIRCYENAKALLTAIQKGAKFNLLLLDVLMDEMDGMALAAELRKQGDQTMIVFVSICQELAHRGYRVKALRYLVKPLNKEDLQEALLHCHKQWQAKKEILLPIAQGQYRTSFPNIQFVEACDRGTRFVLKDETVECKLKFSQVEAMLPKSMFLVCHRAYIVNLSLAKQISPYEFRMKSGAVVPISRYRYNEVNQQFVNFVTD